MLDIQISDKFNFHRNFPFESEEGETQIIETLSQRIAEIYAAFLTLEGHQNREKRLTFCSFPNDFPTVEQVENFKANLKKTIVLKLSQAKETSHIVYLSTGHAPEYLLSEVLDESLGKSHNYALYKLFPSKTKTSIFYKGESISVYMSGYVQQF